MIKLLIEIVKKVILAIFMLYALNLIMVSLNIMIPINALTILIVSILGIPGIFALFLILSLI